MKSLVRELSITLVIALALVLGILTTVQYSIVDGSSMQPSLEDKQRLIVVKVAYTFTSPERGDVVVVQPPFETQKPFVKRIIGIPGDTVEIKSGRVLVNGVPLIEPYIKDAPDYVMKPTHVSDNNYFVLGDNRNDSSDSHYGWTVSRENIIGKVWLRVWPFDAWGMVPGYPLAQELQKLAHTP